MSAPGPTAILATLLALTGCSAAREPAADQPPQKEFSAEDKRIARRLSLGGGETREASSPRFYATLCTLALDSIAERIQDGGMLSGEQSRAFAQAHALWARRAAEGAAPAEREAARKEVEEAYPEPASRARFAIGCLRDLAGG